MSNCFQCGQHCTVYGSDDYDIVPEDEVYCADCLSLIFDEAFHSFASDIVKFSHETGQRPDAYEIVADSVIGGSLQ